MCKCSDHGLSFRKINNRPKGTTQINLHIFIFTHFHIIKKGRLKAAFFNISSDQRKSTSSTPGY